LEIALLIYDRVIQKIPDKEKYMKKGVVQTAVTLMALSLVLVILPSCTGSSESSLTVLNPQGPVMKAKDLAPRLVSLEGKKIAMWLSATSDHLYAGKGAELYDELAGMLKSNYPGVEIVSYNELPMKFFPDGEVVDAIIATQPDGVVVGFGG
jgi:hypothetical protein